MSRPGGLKMQTCRRGITTSINSRARQRLMSFCVCCVTPHLLPRACNNMVLSPHYSDQSSSATPLQAHYTGGIPPTLNAPAPDPCRCTHKPMYRVTLIEHLVCLCFCTIGFDAVMVTTVKLEAAARASRKTPTCNINLMKSKVRTGYWP